MNPLLQCKPTILPLLITLALLCFALLPRVQAVVPAPDGGYPNFNTAEGQNALFSLTSGAGNTALGWFSLNSVTTGSLNTAVGAGTLVLNTGDQNTATGAGALLSNTIGASNTASGAFALFNNTNGGANTANGVSALERNNVGGLNTAAGFFALYLNGSGSSNTAMGYEALFSNTTGFENTAVGAGALTFNNGTGNTALGVFAGGALSTGDNNIDIGYFVDGVAGESNTIRIGNADITDIFISGISGTTVASGAAVLVDSSGHLGTVTSSKRFKEDIKPMDNDSEALLRLKPITFRYRKEIDPAGTSQFGLIAEEVAKVNPTLVLPDKEGKPYTVRYDAVNAMLLNEFLKEHRKVEQQRKDFEAALAQQQKQIEALTAGLQKVSAQLEVSKPAPQVVNNP